MIDDAGFGLVYEDGIYKESAFSYRRCASWHPRSKSMARPKKTTLGDSG